MKTFRLYKNGVSILELNGEKIFEGDSAECFDIVLTLGDDHDMLNKTSVASLRQVRQHNASEAGLLVNNKGVFSG